MSVLASPSMGGPARASTARAKAEAAFASAVREIGGSVGAAIAAELLACLDDEGRFDIAGKPHLLDFISKQFFNDEWIALDAVARTRGAPGITRIVLPATSQWQIEDVVELGVRWLPRVRELVVIDAPPPLRDGLARIAAVNAASIVVPIECRKGCAFDGKRPGAEEN